MHFGKKEFNFFPQTFCLPYDLKQLKRTWEDGGSKQKWIIKPVSLLYNKNSETLKRAQHFLLEGLVLTFSPVTRHVK